MYTKGKFNDKTKGWKAVDCGNHWNNKVITNWQIQWSDDGSCTTGIACINTNRNFIGIENNMDYFNISLKRVEEKRKEKDFNVVTSFGDGM